MSIVAGWLGSDTPSLNRAIVVRALQDIGLLEMPPGSNRSPTIDAYVSAVGSPLGSYWCAAAVAAWFRESGADVPLLNAGSTKAWWQWAHATNRWTTKTAPGRAVLYGDANSIPDHIGVVIRVDPLELTVEGNTSFSQFDRNGVGVDCHELTAQIRPRVLGYIAPLPLTQVAA